ncbi:carbohydrate ABC transporter permease [Bauldia sp.]|uniref:carbohydrate ABC transporter permease n=1 Tax=Bauldia sp. TaxID=2575872 RepID=UPI003BAC74B9
MTVQAPEHTGAIVAPRRTVTRKRSTPGRAYGVMLAPALALFLVFILIPVLLTVIGSFFNFGLTSPSWSFAGFNNYVRAINDPVFWLSLRNNLIIVFGSIILQIGIGTLLAAILDRGIRRGSTFFRTIIFAPMVISSVAVGLIWLMILDPNIGPLNAAVKAVGLTPPMLGWLGDPDLAIWMFLVVAAWQYTGFMMVLILAGLQGVPNEIYQAAALDGARGIRAFWYITLPSLRNILIVAVLITSIGAFKVFDLIYVTTRGGPAHATEVFGTYIYLQAFNLGNMGYANTIAVCLLIIAMILGLLQLKYSRRA